jgi:hypothetical protein
MMMNAGKVPFAALLLALCACAQWTDFRGGPQRTGYQPSGAAFADASKVGAMTQKWVFHAPSPQAFRASPIVADGMVFIGNGNGYFYALDAVSGALKWTYPSGSALTSQFTCNPSSLGIASSAAFAKVGGTDAVIFGAPDQSIGTHLGEGRCSHCERRTALRFGSRRCWHSLPGSPPAAQPSAMSK